MDIARDKNIFLGVNDNSKMTQKIAWSAMIVIKSQLVLSFVSDWLRWRPELKDQTHTTVTGAAREYSGSV